MSILDELDPPKPEVPANPWCANQPTASSKLSLDFHCEKHHRFATGCIPCYWAKDKYWKQKLGKPDSLPQSPPVVGFPDTEPVACVRTTDPAPSHLAAAKIPTKKLWDRMLTIRKLVLTHPGQCIRWYVNVLAEQIPAPELDAPGCRDSIGVPKHDVGFYGVWATLFAQAEKHALIVKVNDPLTPTEKLTKRSPYPGESVVHVYEACTAANMQRMEAERQAYFERLQAQKVVDREAKAAEVAEQRLAKKIATPEKSGFDPLYTAEPSQRA